MINMKLAKERKLSDETIADIIQWQKDCDEYVQHMEREDIDSFFFIEALSMWRLSQSMLQMLWGFDLNDNYHKEWLLPKCICPKSDCEERYPLGMVINEDCPLHGKDNILPKV